MTTAVANSYSVSRVDPQERVQATPKVEVARST
jgi:hypothetical protein